MTEFFHMGGYAGYVWSSYGIAFISLLLGIILPMRANRATLVRLKGRFRREQIQAQESQSQESQSHEFQSQETQSKSESISLQANSPQQTNPEHSSQQEKGEAS